MENNFFSAVVVVGLPCGEFENLFKSAQGTKEFYKSVSDHGFEIIVPYQDAALSETFVGWIVASSPCSWYSALSDEFCSTIQSSKESFKRTFGVTPTVVITNNHYSN